MMENERVVSLLIKGAIEDSTSSDDSVELITEGLYYLDGDTVCVQYDETDIYGMEGTTTVIKIRPEKVELVRLGTINSIMEFETGKRNVTLYTTPYGELAMSILTKKITIDEKDGLIHHVLIEYAIEIGGVTNANSSVNISIQFQDNSE